MLSSPKYLIAYTTIFDWMLSETVSAVFWTELFISKTSYSELSYIMLVLSISESKLTSNKSRDIIEFTCFNIRSNIHFGLWCCLYSSFLRQYRYICMQHVLQAAWTYLATRALLLINSLISAVFVEDSNGFCVLINESIWISVANFTGQYKVAMSLVLEDLLYSKVLDTIQRK